MANRVKRQLDNAGLSDEYPPAQRLAKGRKENTLPMIRNLRILFSLLALCGFLISCAPTMSPDRPPETYRGPIAELPVLQRGDYWVYRRGDSTRTKTTAIAPNVGFPLWIGKSWNYGSEGLPRGRNAPTSQAPRTPTRIDCQVTTFRQIVVGAGTFGAFECECQCKTISVAYEPECGKWTFWYAPDVKNIIRINTEGSTATMELIDYKASR
jgi:hypothetical protein